MKAVLAAATLILLTADAALAQAPPQVASEPETVYSNAQREKDAQTSRRFVQSLLQPSLNLEGQFSKWKGPICPHVVGMAPAAAYVVERRIREIAQQVGAPVERRDPCKPNVVAFVTPEPQATLDAIVARDSLRLLTAAPDRDLTVRYPVQAWYASYYRDYDGFLHLDAARDVAQPWKENFPPFGEGGPQPLNADAVANLTRLHTGMLPEMSDATVIVDAGAIKGMTLGSLGDYLALMTLAQAPATGRCQPAPSIANLFLKDCEADFHTTALSDVDLAMLNALYQTPDEPEKLQMTRLIGNMQRDLEGENRK